MTVFTAAELSNYRTRPHRSNLKLVIYRPAVILAAEVGIVATEDHATLIPFTNVTSGSYANIRPGMTMYVGTAPGKADLGRVRIKDYATSVYVEVARNSMRWSLNPYLTVVDFYEIWPKYIQEIQSGTSTEHYKDWDIGYSDQNGVMGTLLNVGSHAVCEAGNQVYQYMMSYINAGQSDILRDISPPTLVTPQSTPDTTGVRTNTSTTSNVQIGVSLSPDLRGEIIEASVGAVADITLRSI